MRKIKVLVSGASGFIGRNLSEHLASRPEQYEVLACTDATADLRDSEAVKRLVEAFSPDRIINCAAIVGTRKNAYGQGGEDIVAVNLRIFFNLLRAMRPDARLIQLGSGAEYDFRAYQPKIKEEAFGASVPEDPYGFSKYVASAYAEKASNVTVLRIFGIYGRYEDYTFKFISNAIVKNLLGLPIVINQNAKFDYLYIGDFVKLVEPFLRGVPRWAHYNITPTQSADLLSLAGLINGTGERKSEVRVINPGLNKECTGSNARLLAEFPGVEFTSYAEGIKELYAYYRENLAKLDLAAVKEDAYLKNCRTTL